MSEENNKALDTIKKYAPDTLAWSRALISGIPFVGGSLDHLIFDKASDIRFQKLEQSVKNIEQTISHIEEGRIVAQWFESLEALEMFKQLFEKIEFEPSDNKIRTLSQIYTLFGTKEHVEDRNKKAVLETISRLTENQIVIFKAINELPSEKKEIGDNIIYTVTARWQSALLQYCKSRLQIMQQLKGHVALDEELDILASFNLIVNIGIPTNKDIAYRISALGQRAYSYLQES